MSSSFLKPPRLRPAEGEEGRRATPFELFFDLVFVLAIAELSRTLRADLSAAGYLRFFALSVPTWWAWVIYTTYADRFDTDDVVYRLLMMVGMLAVASMSVAIPHTFVSGGGALHFVASYLVVRAIPFLLYLRAGRYVARGREIARGYGTASAAAAVFWLGFAFVPGHARYICFAVAVAIEVANPFIRRRTVAATPVSVPHVAERFGLFTIIVLGETVVSVGAGLLGVHWHLSSILVAVFCFAIAGCLWWTYFDFTDGEAPLSRGFWTGQLYIYGHMPIVVGLTALGAGSRLAIEHAGQRALSSGVEWALCGGVALYMLAIGLIDLVATGSSYGGLRSVRLWVAGGALLLGSLGGGLPPPVLVGLLLVALVIEVSTELARGARERPSPAFASLAETPSGTNRSGDIPEEGEFESDRP